MPHYDLVTVVYDEEIDLLALQAKSIALFGQRLSINRIYVIANGPNQTPTIRRIHKEVLPKYGQRGAQVQIIPARNLMHLSESAPGWHSQQVLKLAIASRIDTDFYITLDAKNHLVRDVDDSVFFNERGVPLFYPTSLRGMSSHFLNSAEICGIDWKKNIDRAYPTITPATLYTMHVRDLHRFIADNGEETFEYMLCNKHMEITEYMLYYCYLRRIGEFNKLYTPGPRIVITLWSTQVDDDKIFQHLMHEVEGDAVPFFSLHRLARERLTPQQSARIACFWRRIGLASDEREANRYLGLKPQNKLAETMKRHLMKALPAEAATRLQGALGGWVKLNGAEHPIAATSKPNGHVNISVKAVAADGTSHFELRDRLMSLARRLRPMKAVGYAKKRFGSRNDGGYVMLDDFNGVKAAFSLGIAGNVDWDKAIASKNIPVYQFDHSIGGVAIAHPNFRFFPAMVGPGDGQVSFDEIASRYADGPLDVASAIMKMDIEHWEWPTLAAAGTASLRKFRQLVVEFHCMDLIANPYWWQQAEAVLAKLQQEFFVVHVHGNVVGGALVIGGIPFPNVLEVTFASRHYYEPEETDELFPTSLDASCDPRMPDLYLGSFKF